MTDLTKITGVGPSTAKSLQEQGYSTAEDLAEAEPSDIEVPVGSADEIIGRAKRMSTVSKTGSDLLEEYQNATFASTGVTQLDTVLGGGIEQETICCVYGQSGKGKTQVAFSTMVENAAEGTVVYLQTEDQSKSISERMAKMAEGSGYDPVDILDNIVIYEAYSVADQYETYQVAFDNHPDMELFVIDSFQATFRMSGDFDGRENLGDRSEVMGKHLRQLSSLMREYETPILMTGQVYSQPEAYKKPKLWGGDKMVHFIPYFICMSSGQGELMEAELENHPGMGEESVLLNIDDDGVQGIDK